MPGRESRDKRGRSTKPPVLPTVGGFRSGARASDGSSDRKVPAPLQGAIGTRQSGRQTSGFDRRSSDPLRPRRNRSVDGSNAASPRRETAPDPIRRDVRDSGTARREPQRTPWGNRAVPTTPAR